MIHVFAGTKAELIKIGPFMRELADRGIEYNFIWSGQHNETLAKLLVNFGIKKPDIVLYRGPEITQVGQMAVWFFKVLFRAIWKRKSILRNDDKGVVVVHGDTVTTVMGAIFGRVSGMRVAHLESGLTSNNLFRPFPEEIDRRIVFMFANYYFCPNGWAIKNLGKRSGVVVNTYQNTLYDSVVAFIDSDKKRKDHIPMYKYALCSLHRFENVYRKSVFVDLVELLEKTAKDVKILFIMHQNTKENLIKFGLYNRIRNNPNFEIRQRYDYFDFVQLINNCEFFISDGGSNQEESSYLGVPTIILRSETERIEGLGKNVVITNYNFYVISEFVRNYKHFRYPLLKLKDRPSKIVVDKLVKDGFSKKRR